MPVSTTERLGELKTRLETVLAFASVPTDEQAKALEDAEKLLARVKELLCVLN